MGARALIRSTQPTIRAAVEMEFLKIAKDFGSSSIRVVVISQSKIRDPRPGKRKFVRRRIVDGKPLIFTLDVKGP